ncbi:DUF1499 domain-containing protein [Granulosicoccus sp. 3-233]|uniref:DUF1499 domain-containing protein n=1 Tax=Granulosicoccus sp. 3-233 TaxID=3417969 RepID=UPI003D3448AD
MSTMKNMKLFSTLALLASVLSVLAMAGIVLAYRGDSFGFREASGYLRTAAQISVFVAGFCLIVALLSWKNKASLLKALIAGAIVLVPLGVMKMNMPAGTALFGAAPAGPPPGAGAKGPADPNTAPINDISTDTQNPPVFSAVVALRPEGSNAIEYAGPDAAAAQAAQFPDIKPIDTLLSKTEAFDRALEVANDMDLQIVAQDADSGIIEAIASTRFFNFQDDVIIRVSGSGASSIVDIRSHSRIGRSDRGKNAERVRAFVERF